MNLEAEYDALIDGVRDAELRAALNKDMGVYDGSESDIESFLSPGCWLDNTTVDACVRLFTTPFSKQMVSLPTWTQHMEDWGGLQRPAIQRVNLAMFAEGGKALKAVIWPFLITNHFILCIIRPDYTATILDSMGNGGKFIDIVRQQLDKYEAWRQWRIVVGESALQNNMNDCGVYCIANAAFTIANRPLPSTINVDFWRVACWSAMGMADADTDLAQSPFFDYLRGPFTSVHHVLEALRRVQDDDGLAVLRTLAIGPPNKWWHDWSVMLRALTRTILALRETCSAIVDEPSLEGRLESLQLRAIREMVRVDKCERGSGRTRREFAITMAAQTRMGHVHQRMAHLENVAVPIIRGNAAGEGA